MDFKNEEIDELLNIVEEKITDLNNLEEQIVNNKVLKFNKKRIERLESIKDKLEGEIAHL